MKVATRFAALAAIVGLSVDEVLQLSAVEYAAARDRRFILA